MAAPLLAADIGNSHTMIGLVADGQVLAEWRVATADPRTPDEAEVLLVMKTRADRLPALTARVRALHPYDLPEIVALATAGGSDAYFDWVRAESAP